MIETVYLTKGRLKGQSQDPRGPECSKSDGRPLQKRRGPHHRSRRSTRTRLERTKPRSRDLQVFSKLVESAFSVDFSGLYSVPGKQLTYGPTEFCHPGKREKKIETKKSAAAAAAGGRSALPPLWLKLSQQHATSHHLPVQP